MHSRSPLASCEETVKKIATFFSSQRLYPFFGFSQTFNLKSMRLPLISAKQSREGVSQLNKERVSAWEGKDRRSYDLLQSQEYSLFPYRQIAASAHSSKRYIALFENISLIERKRPLLSHKMSSFKPEFLRYVTLKVLDKKEEEKFPYTKYR